MVIITHFVPLEIEKKNLLLKVLVLTRLALIALGIKLLILLQIKKIVCQIQKIVKTLDWISN